MNLSFFSRLDEYQIANIMSYITIDDLYNNRYIFNKSWQKAAIISLLSRCASYEDILQQKKLFEKNINSYLKEDNQLISTILSLELLSTASLFSTPMHKLQGSLFLCKLHKIPDGVMSDEYVMFCGRLSFALEEDSDFDSRGATTLAAISNMLSQAQSSRIIQSIMLKIQQLRALKKSDQYDYENKIELDSASHTLLALLPRAQSTDIELLITQNLQELWCNGYDVTVLSFLKKYVCKLDDAQNHQIITAIIAQLNYQYCYFPEVFKNITPFSSKLTRDQANIIATKSIQQIFEWWHNDSNDCLDVFIACVDKLHADDAYQLVTTTILPKEEHWAKYKLIEILAPKLMPNHAYMIYLELLSRLKNWSFSEHTREALNVLILSLELGQIQEIITNNLSKIKTNIKVTYQSGWKTMPGDRTDLMEPAEIDKDETPGKFLEYDSEPLEILILFRSSLTPGQVSSIFETMVSILNNKSSTAIFVQYYIALKTLRGLLPRLTAAEVNIAFITLDSILNNQDACSVHKDVLETLKVLAHLCTEPQAIIIFSKIIPMLSNPIYRQDSTHELTERRASDLVVKLLQKCNKEDQIDQIDQICSAIEALNMNDSKISDDLRNAVLNTITALAPQLNEIQVNRLFIKIISIRSYDLNSVIRLKALAALTDKLEPSNVDIFLMNIFDYSYEYRGYSDTEKLDFYKIKLNLATELLSKLKKEDDSLTLISMNHLNVPIDHDEANKMLQDYLANGQLFLETNWPTVLKLNDRYFVYGRSDGGKWTFTELDATKMVDIDFREANPGPSDSIKIWKQISKEGHIQRAPFILMSIISLLTANPKFNDEASAVFPSLCKALQTYTSTENLSQLQVDILYEQCMLLAEQNSPESSTPIMVFVFQVLVFRLREGEQVDKSFTYVLSELSNGNNKKEGDFRRICDILGALTAFLPRLNKEQIQTVWTSVNPFLSSQHNETRHIAILLIHTLLLANQLHCDVLQQHLKDTVQPSPFLIEAILFLTTTTQIRIDLVSKLQIANVSEAVLAPR